MNLKEDSYQEVLILSQEIKKWLDYYEKNKTAFDANPDLVKKRAGMEHAQELIITTLKRSKAAIMNKKLLKKEAGFELEWWTDTPITTNQKEVTLYFNIASLNSDKLKTEEMTHTIEASFSDGSKVAGAATFNAANKEYTSIGFTSNITFPITFLSGDIQVKISTVYKGSTHSIQKKTTLNGISAEGQAIITFLTALQVNDKLKLNIQNALKKYAAVETLTKGELEVATKELLVFKKELDTVFDAYQNFAHNALIPRLFGGDQQTIEDHFGRHWLVEFKDKAPAKNGLQFLDFLRFPTKVQKSYRTPLAEKIASIGVKLTLLKEEIAKAELNYEAAKNNIAQKSALGADLISQIYAITLLDRDFETLQATYDYISDADQRDAFRLVIKPKDEIDTITTALDKIHNDYLATSNNIRTIYSEMYKKNGKLKDKGLKAEAKIKDEKIAELELYIAGGKNPILLHKFMFDSILIMLDQAKSFLVKFESDFKQIRADFQHIKTEGNEQIIAAYNPTIDQEIKDKFIEQDLANKSIEEKNKSSIVYGSKKSELTNDKTTKGINPEDVDQGSLGDCYFLSGVESLAQFDPETIFGGKDSIIQGPDDKGLYTVQLYIPDGQNEKKRIKIKVEPTFVEKTVATKKTGLVDPNNSFNTDTNPAFAQTNESNEIWVQLLEKAMTQLEGSYIESEGSESDISLTGLEMLTGKSSTSYRLPKELVTAVTKVIAESKILKKVPMAKFSTKSDFGVQNKLASSGEDSIEYREGITLYANHAYSLGSIKNDKKGSEEFTLKNPHSDKDIKGGESIDVNLAELTLYFDVIELQ